MNNAKIMKQFQDTHHHEIGALIEDLGLQDVKICFDGRRPEGIREDPTLMWEYQQFEPGDGTDLGFTIRFCWNNIIDHENELRYGLIVLAECLHAVSQQVRDVLSQRSFEYQSGRYIELAYQARLQEAGNYAYEAVLRLFTLFSDDEVKTMMDYGCFCKRCRKEALRGLRPRRVALSA